MEIKLASPQPKQREFLLAKERFVCFGGSRGGGKSWVVRYKALVMAVKHSGIKILLLRRTYPELRENHIIPIMQITGKSCYREIEKAFIFPNGSRIKLGYLDNETDVLQYQGQEYDIVFLDEATQFTEFMFNTLKACIRGANKFPKRMYLTCNPGGVGHEWVKRLFIDKIYKSNENPEDYRFIASSVYDNRALLENDSGYVSMLESLSDNLRRAWLLGDWNVFEGQYFPEFDEKIHVVEPFEIPKDWRIYTSMDYGLDMLAHYEYAIDNERNVYVTKEIYKSDMVVSDAAEKIKEVSPYAYLRLAPPDLTQRQSITGKSTLDLFYEHGLSFTVASNDRIAGWLAVKELLKVFTGKDGRQTAKLKIFRNCKNLIRCIPLQQYDDKKPNDTAREPHEITHSVDALRYFAIYWTRPNESDSKEKRIKYRPDQLEDYFNARTDEERQRIIKKFGGKPEL